MVLDKKCKNCGGIIKFNPKTQKMECDHCSGSYDITPETQEEREQVSNYYDVYTCPDCGAKILADPNTTSTFCVYCKNTAILKDKMQGEFNPQMIIPFKKTKEDATLAFEKLREGRKLIPDTFLDTKNIDEIKAIYIPFWLISINADVNFVAEGHRTRSEFAFGGHYIVTSNFNIVRKGNLVFSRVPVDGSIHFDDAIMESIEPFNYNELVPYSSDYLSGFYSELYDVSSEEAFKNVKQRTTESTYNFFLNNANQNKKYNSVDLNRFDFDPKNVNNEYVLLPVWLLNVKYKNKCYPFAMNGQTGEMIGDIPYDKKKAFKLFLIVFLISLVILLVIGFYCWKAMW